MACRRLPVARGNELAVGGLLRFGRPLGGLGGRRRSFGPALHRSEAAAGETIDARPRTANVGERAGALTGRAADVDLLRHPDTPDHLAFGHFERDQRWTCR